MVCTPLRCPIAVTMGDPAGVGPEVTARAWAARRDHALPPFVAIGDIAAITAVWDGPVARVGDMGEAVRTFAEALPVCPLEERGPPTPGQPTPAAATCAPPSPRHGLGLPRTQATAAPDTQGL